MANTRVFISYAFVDEHHPDYLFVQRFAEDLRRAGADVVVDTANVGEQAFVQRLNRVLPTCPWLIVIQSPEALQSLRVQMSVNMALQLVTQRQMQEVLAVVATSCDTQDMPLTWNTLAVIDASEDYPKALARALLLLGLASSTNQADTQPDASLPLEPRLDRLTSVVFDRPSGLSRLSTLVERETAEKDHSQSLYGIDRPASTPPLSIEIVEAHENRIDRPKPFSRRRSSRRLPMLIAALLLLLVILLVVLRIVFKRYYTYQAVTATSVIVDISPQVQVINQVYTITASPDVQTPDVGTASIPDRALSQREQASLSESTTGQVCGVFGVFNCKQAVSQDDVNGLVNQMQPTLEHKISQALQQQVTAARGTIVIPVNPSIISETADPPVGSPGKTVTVTLVEQGSTRYIANRDVESVARQLLIQQAQQSWPSYLLINSSITMSAPVVEGVDPNSGKVTIEIAAGGVVAYQFSSAQLQSIENALKNKTVSAARNYLMHLPGINPKTVGIHFTNGGGDTLPGIAQQIKIVTSTPGTLPDVQLQHVPAPTLPLSTDSGTTTSPTASPMQTGDNNNNN
jgi:hypothetical protein